MLSEQNIILKNVLKSDLRVGLCFPNLYRTAMSSLGYQILYEFINKREELYAERIIYPSVRSMETNSPLRDFDIVCFSLQYEEDYFNVLKMLLDSGIPINKKDRGADDPLIIAGGPCASSNPLPMTDFIDLFVVGEAEVMLDNLLDLYLEIGKNQGLDAYRSIPGVYVEDEYVHRVIVKDMDFACHPKRFISSVTDDENLVPVFGSSILLGVSRGCSRGCRFCMSSYMYRPQRETSLNKLFSVAEESRSITGFNKVSLIGAAVSDYSHIDDLCAGLVERGFQVSTPSLRVESITDDTLKFLAEGGLKTLTLAPESLYDIRKRLNKGFTDENVSNIVSKAVEYNMNLKLYYLIGTPLETKEDINDLSIFMKNLSKISPKKSGVKFSVNPLIPKPHTPMQWTGFNLTDIKQKIKFLRKTMGNVPIKFNSPRLSLTQYVLSCKGKEISNLIVKNVKSNVSTSEWKKHSTGYQLDETLPWKNIDLDLKSDFLLNEREKMLNNELTPWCVENGCYGCSDY